MSAPPPIDPYEAYLEFRLSLDPEVRYSLYDLNGGGAEELILRLSGLCRRHLVY